MSAAGRRWVAGVPLLARAAEAIGAVDRYDDRSGGERVRFTAEADRAGPSRIRRALRCAAVAATCWAMASLAAPHALGWGRVGHQVVAELASRELDDVAREAVRDLLRSSLAAASTWADEIRRQRPNTARWHYVNIPIEEPYDEARDCPSGQCVVGALERQFELLRDPARSRAARAEALRWVIHLVGDLHQPLHCGDRGDRGGTDVEVRWFRRRSNLHRVWDSDVIAEAGLSTPQLTAQLRAALGTQDRAMAQETASQASTSLPALLEEWANEARELARNHAYALPGDRQLGAAYYEQSWPVVQQQLVRAAMRLARLLNAVLAETGAQSAAQPLRSPGEAPTAPSAGPTACRRAAQCCRVCSAGQACGDSCISRSYTCRTPPGCACDSSEICR